MIESLDKGAIADLVMVLQRVDELPGGSIARRRAALFFEPTARRPLALIEPALLDAAGDFVERARVVGVVALVVARQITAHGVVEVVRPDRVADGTALFHLL